MNKTTAWLVWTKNRTWRCYIPPSGGNPHLKHLPFGSSHVPVPITKHKVQSHEIGFPVHIKTDKNRENLRLPPLIGILTSKHPTRAGFRGNRANFRDIIESGRRMGVIVFVFIANDFDETSGYTVGYTCHPAYKQWIRLVFPQPDVVYNRIPDRKTERRAAEQKALKFFLANPQTELFNPHFFDKQELFHWFSNDRTLRSHLPDTTVWGPLEALTHYVRQYDTVYIKPSRGKAGTGIMQISKKSGRYQLTYVTGKADTLLHFHTTNLQDLYRKINSLINGQPYMIQQGIPLCRYEGRPFDCRLLVQKKRDGRWGVTGLGIRVASPKGITTHVPRGGQIGKPNNIFPRVFGSHAKSVYERAAKLAIAVAKGIERQSDQQLGEISIDLGIDRRLNMWVFEANAKPMKFDEPRIRKRSLERLIEYACYLYEGRHGVVYS